MDKSHQFKNILDFLWHSRAFVFPVLMIAVFISGCSTTKNISSAEAYHYKPDSQELYDSIIHLDSIFFGAYNTCNLELQASIYSDSIEFYHDKGGLMTSKQELLDATKKNICGKVTRELVKGSIEVYPIKNYGAVEMGLHKFHNNTEKETKPSEAGRFIIIWQHKNDEWKIRRVISLH